MENSLVVLHLLGKKQETCFWWYHTQICFEQSQQTQFDIFHTKMLQNTSRCHVTASIWILCNILENIPHALDVHAQRVLNIETGVLRYYHSSQNTARFFDVPHLIRTEDLESFWRSWADMTSWSTSGVVKFLATGS